jgi:hypothetical protein
VLLSRAGRTTRQNRIKHRIRGAELQDGILLRAYLGEGGVSYLSKLIVIFSWCYLRYFDSYEHCMDRPNWFQLIRFFFLRVVVFPFPLFSFGLGKGMLECFCFIHAHGSCSFAQILHPVFLGWLSVFSACPFN